MCLVKSVIVVCVWRGGINDVQLHFVRLFFFRPRGRTRFGSRLRPHRLPSPTAQLSWATAIALVDHQELLLVSPLRGALPRALGDAFLQNLSTDGPLEPEIERDATAGSRFDVVVRGWRCRRQRYRSDRPGKGGRPWARPRAPRIRSTWGV